MDRYILYVCGQKCETSLTLLYCFPRTDMNIKAANGNLPKIKHDINWPDVGGSSAGLRCQLLDNSHSLDIFTWWIALAESYDAVEKVQSMPA